VAGEHVHAVKMLKSRQRCLTSRATTSTPCVCWRA